MHGNLISVTVFRLGPGDVYTRVAHNEAIVGKVDLPWWFGVHFGSNSARYFSEPIGPNGKPIDQGRYIYTLFKVFLILSHPA